MHPGLRHLVGRLSQDVSLCCDSNPLWTDFAHWQDQCTNRQTLESGMGWDNWNAAT